MGELCPESGVYDPVRCLPSETPDSRPMRSIVTFLLLALLGAIAAFLISNTTPIALTFLGMQTLALPLAVWIAGALLAGVATGLWFLILFRLAERRGARREREQRRAEFGPDDFAVVNDGLEAREYASSKDYEAKGYAASYRDGADRERQAPAYGDDRYDDGAVFERAGRARDADYADYRDTNDRDTNYRDSEVQASEVRAVGGVYEPLATDEPSYEYEPLDLGDRSTAEAEFEVVDASVPVYDANYRVIQPPAEGDWQRRDERDTSYRDESYRDEQSYGEPEPRPPAPYAAANSREDSEDEGDRPTYKTAPSYPPSGRSSPKKSQSKDDWDIEEDLNW